MPIPDTKYNKHVNKLFLYNELSNNSLFHNIDAEINGCDKNILNSNININTPYLTNKANYLINEFSDIRNCVSQFDDDQNSVFKYKAPSQCHSCIDTSNSHSEDIIQRIIQNQSRVESSLYTKNLSSLIINSDFSKNQLRWDNRSDRLNIHGKKNQVNSSIKANYGVDIKHNSYYRYLGKKTGNYLIGENKDTNVTPKYGNKTYKFGLIKCNSNKCY
tara:strand:+ start:856 stop:1506 length:651 start_codon:yes stop_codon:yes gene_type:complete